MNRTLLEAVLSTILNSFVEQVFLSESPVQEKGESQRFSESFAS